MANKSKYANMYINKYSDSTAKKYLSKKLKASITTSEDFGEIGTKQYRDRIKVYFGLGSLDRKAVASIKDEQKKFRILAEYSAREQEIYSGYYLHNKIVEARENLEFILKQYGTLTDHQIKSILDRASYNRDKEFAILSAMWNKVNDYYTSVKENYHKTKGRNNPDLERDMEDVVSGLLNVLDEFNE